MVTASGGLYDTHLSTRLNFAFRLGGTYFADLWSLRLQYARVEPEYETMGAIYTQSDIEDITIAPTMRLADGTLRFNASLGFRHDNLFDDRIATTSRVIGSANVNWMPAPSFGLDAQYSNYSMSSSAGSLPVNDSTRIQNVSESYSLTPRYTVTTGSMQYFFMLFLTRQNYSDENILTGAASDNNVFTAVLSAIMSMQSGLGFSAAWSGTTTYFDLLVRADCGRSPVPLCSAFTAAARSRHRRTVYALKRLRAACAFPGLQTLCSISKDTTSTAETGTSCP